MVPQNYLWKLNCTSQRYQSYWKLTEKAFKKPIKKDYIKEKKPTKYMKKLSTKVGERVLLALVTLKRYQWLEKCKLNEYSSVLGVKCFEVERAFSTKRRCKLCFYLSAHFLLVLCWKCITLKMYNTQVKTWFINKCKCALCFYLSVIHFDQPASSNSNPSLCWTCRQKHLSCSLLLKLIDMVSQAFPDIFQALSYSIACKSTYARWNPFYLSFLVYIENFTDSKRIMISWGWLMQY